MISCASYYEGCPCKSICNGQFGSCSSKGCDGINVPGGVQGICTGGDYRGCSCNSICWDHDGDYGSNDCNGINKICQNGIYKGCSCSTSCGNLVSQPCV